MGLQDYVRQELSRLEKQAQNAYTEGEALNCELKAVELQISLVSHHPNSTLNSRLWKLQIPLVSEHPNSTVNSRLLNSNFSVKSPSKLNC